MAGDARDRAGHRQRKHTLPAPGRPLRDLSYGVYIYAFPVQQTLISLLRERLSWGAILASTLCTVGLLAFASWHLVEKRALRLKPRRRSSTSTALARA